MCRYAEAQEAANGVLSLDNLNADAIYVRGLCLYYEDNLDRAISHFTQVSQSVVFQVRRSVCLNQISLYTQYLDCRFIHSNSFSLFCLIFFFIYSRFRILLFFSFHQLIIILSIQDSPYRFNPIPKPELKMRVWKLRILSLEILSYT